MPTFRTDQMPYGGREGQREHEGRPALLGARDDRGAPGRHPALTPARDGIACEHVDLGGPDGPAGRKGRAHHRRGIGNRAGDRRTARGRGRADLLRRHRPARTRRRRRGRRRVRARRTRASRATSTTRSPRASSSSAASTSRTSTPGSRSASRISPQLTDDVYQRIMRVNVDGVVYGTRAAIRSMRARGGGAIVATSSLAGIIPFPPDPVYDLAKARGRRLHPQRRAHARPARHHREHGQPGHDRHEHPDRRREAVLRRGGLPADAAGADRRGGAHDRHHGAHRRVLGLPARPRRRAVPVPRRARAADRRRPRAGARPRSPTGRPDPGSRRGTRYAGCRDRHRTPTPSCPRSSDADAAPSPDGDGRRPRGRRAGHAADQADPHRLDGAGDARGGPPRAARRRGPAGAARDPREVAARARRRALARAAAGARGRRPPLHVRHAERVRAAHRAGPARRLARRPLPRDPGHAVHPAGHGPAAAQRDRPAARRSSPGAPASGCPARTSRPAIP